MMQRLKAAVLARRGSLGSCRFLPHCSRRGLCSLPDTALNDDLDNQVLVEGKAWSRTAVLNRPSVLNALNSAMGLRLQKLYRSWEDNPDVGFIALKGSGKAFCAGGDVVSLYHLINEGRMEDCKEFFRALYPFTYLLGTCLKPHVAILNGVTMGGGGGVSIPGTFRIATDKTVFATPETLIGFHPDAGASFYLSHLPGHLGEFLALTSEKLNGPEMLACGLATHYLHNKHGEPVHPDKSSVLHRIELLDECFSHDTVEEIIDALEIEAGRTKDPWCISTLKRLKEVSPLSLKVSLRSIREGRFQTLDQCLVREYRMSLQGISKQITGDFCEGVRARLVEKDSAPKDPVIQNMQWDPPSVEKVTKDMVDQYFVPLSEFEPDLELPTESREAFI
ncbi:3-hydroxyisobutyryl-CoA hydrolase-like protein 1, mitochondrial isoform X3 [Rosa rugosa]|uniref:3-hydroxyisobutyryl-CoA hydrolase-like protein 1, mitochondrial isoform X3 n=1 Tax=Rosa rugosa TaxID=74645 RepID=UPI002B4052BD|nr:3-hydroxyisobutyryl-CoA hydrolase-like protein 1, mitochondrial isoform X3 [Rosa rugosa]